MNGESPGSEAQEGESMEYTRRHCLVLDYIREQRNITRREICNVMNLNDQVWSRWCNGINKGHSVPARLVEGFMEFLEITPEELEELCRTLPTDVNRETALIERARDQRMLLDVIDDLKDEKALSNYELASMVGQQSQKQWSVIHYNLNHSSQVKYATLEKYAQALGTSLDEIRNAVSRVGRKKAALFILGEYEEPVKEPEPDPESKCKQTNAWGTPPKPVPGVPCIIRTALKGLECSVCRKWVPDMRYNYCPWCGIGFVKEKSA